MRMEYFYSDNDLKIRSIRYLCVWMYRCTYSVILPSRAIRYNAWNV
jgi:hypothetical protein